MATSLATIASTTPRISLGRSFLLPSIAHKHNAVINEMSALPSQQSEFNLQIPLNKLVAGKSRREYMTSESVFSQGDPANAVFFVQSGKVKLTVVSMSGKEAVIAHLPTSSFFGEA